MLQLVAVLAYLVLGCGQSRGDLSLHTRIPDIIAHLCPGSDVCSSSRSSDTADDIDFDPGVNSCCAGCSCSPDCSKTGQCCFPNTSVSNQEMEGKLHNLQNSHTCLYPMSPQPTTNQHLYQSFLMVSSVQKGVNTNRQERQSNISCGDLNVTPWGSLYPVYSARSNRIYKNIECARADGEYTDVIIWDAYISCENVQMSQGITSAINGLDTATIPENCHINFIFPSDFNALQPLICYTNLINTCSESVDFQVPAGTNVSKDDIRKLCTNSGIVSPYRAKSMYANVFCHICNAESFYRQKTCQRYTGSMSPKTGNALGFIAMIDGIFISETRHVRKEEFPVACFQNDVNKCRQIFCPTGQLRDRTSKCVYPIKIWYDQTYVVYVNLTSHNSINVSEVFNIKHEEWPVNVLPPFRSAWLNNWQVNSIYYRVTDVPYISNNLLFVMNRKLSSVNPSMFIANIKGMIRQSWSLKIGNATEVLKSSSFSVRKSLMPFSNSQQREKAFDLQNLETPKYKQIFYKSTTPDKREHIITKLYICDQVELDSSEFVLVDHMRVMYINSTKRFLFDNQFAIIHDEVSAQRHVRICIEDSGLYKKDKTLLRNVGTQFKTFDDSFVGVSVLFILLYQIM